ncbi:MAG: hypothetical protein IK133_06285 [Clostridia bacterium]|nr:hypothetical protein [Clostridia bacterium]MBR5383415.1 hypothetical protein [Clostridia bacterium]
MNSTFIETNGVLNCFQKNSRPKTAAYEDFAVSRTDDAYSSVFSAATMSV